MIKKSFSILLVLVLCLGMLVGCGVKEPANRENYETPEIEDNTNITDVDDVEIVYEGDFISDKEEYHVDGKVRVPELPVGGMPTKRAEIPTVAHDIGNNWNANIDRIAITGGSAITINFGNVRDGSTSAPEDGFKGSFSGGSDAGFGSGPHGPGAGSDWGAGSFEVASTFDITDDTNYFVSKQEAVIVE